jgi:predicted RNase H-like HicB family nuclease
MLYPVYIHIGNEKHAHGVMLPDFEGCFSAADTWEALPDAIQEAAESYFYDGAPVPPPSKLEELEQNESYRGGVWMLADINTSKLSTDASETNFLLQGINGPRLLRAVDDINNGRNLEVRTLIS